MLAFIGSEKTAVTLAVGDTFLPVGNALTTVGAFVSLTVRIRGVADGVIAVERGRAVGGIGKQR